MAYISNELTNEIQNRCDIVEVISKYVQLSKRGKNYFGLCPFHDDHNASMSVSPDKQIYKCFSCGESGNVFTFTMMHGNTTATGNVTDDWVTRYRFTAVCKFYTHIVHTMNSNTTDIFLCR